MSSTTRHALLSALTSARRLRRGVALLACVGVLGWTLLTATHWHGEAESSRQHGVAECVLCLGMVAGAAPPAPSLLQLLPPPVALRLPEAAPWALLSTPLPAYRSRAPPTA